MEEQADMGELVMGHQAVNMRDKAINLGDQAEPPRGELSDFNNSLQDTDTISVVVSPAEAAPDEPTWLEEIDERDLLAFLPAASLTTPAIQGDLDLDVYDEVVHQVNFYG